MQNKKLATLIYNPLAGMLDVQPSIANVEDFWSDRGWRVDVRATRRAGHAHELAAQAVKAGHRMVLVAGGDGTLGEVVGGVANSDCILAPLPSGTGNSFAKELAMPLRNPLGKRDLVRACEVLSTGHIRSVDVGVCNEKRFWLQWTGIGADGHVIRRIEPRTRRTRRLGSIGYVALSLLALPDYKGATVSISVDEKIFHGRYVMIIISNCRYYAAGQVNLNPTAVLDDGLFEVTIFEGTGFRDVLGYMIDLYLERHSRNPRIKVVQGRKIEVTSDVPSPVHHDGDPAGFTPVNCRLEPQALRLLVPRTAPVELFQGQSEPFPG